MRIIVTNLGKEAVKNLNIDTIDKPDVTKFIKHDTTKHSGSKNLLSPKMNNLNNLNNLNSHNRGRRSGFSSSKNSNYKSSPKQMELDLISSANSPDRMVFLKQKKLNIPKNISDKYVYHEDNSSRDGKDKDGKPKLNFILPILPDKLFDREGLNNADSEMPKCFSLRKIIGEPNLKELKHKMHEDKKMKDRHFIYSPKVMRQPLIDNTPFKNLEEDLDNTIIDSDKINLLKYLSSKNFSEKTIHRIANFDDLKKNRINKLCQIAEHNDDNLKKILTDIQFKVEQKYASVKGEYKEEMYLAKEDINITEKIIANYPPRIIKKDVVYNEQLNDIHKIWKKYDLNRFGSRLKRNNSMGSYPTLDISKSNKFL